MEYFDKTFTLDVRGDYACFTRPEMKVERVSYDVITPSAARAIFTAIFWKPAIRWHVRKIEVLKPIRWTSVRRNEVGAVASDRSDGIFIEDARQQRAGLFLRDVAYRLHADLEFIPPPKRPKVSNPVPDALILASERTEWEKTKTPASTMRYSNAEHVKANVSTSPILGCREFSCAFRLLENLSDEPPPISETRDLGFMLYDLDFTDETNPKPAFFRPQMNNGVIDVPPWESDEVRK